MAPRDDQGWRIGSDDQGSNDRQRNSSQAQQWLYFMVSADAQDNYGIANVTGRVIFYRLNTGHRLN